MADVMLLLLAALCVLVAATGALCVIITRRHAAAQRELLRHRNEQHNLDEFLRRLDQAASPGEVDSLIDERERGTEWDGLSSRSSSR